MHEIDRAMQVLEIHSQLEDRDHEKEEPLKDNEVAVLKEMCNVSLLTASRCNDHVSCYSGYV